MDRGMDDEPGIAEVHTHIGFQPSGARDRSTPSEEGVDDFPGEVHDRGGGRSTRAREAVFRARGQAGDFLTRAANAVEERTGLIGKARDNPLAAIGIAFAVGFLVAGRSETSSRFSKTKQQLRGAIIGAVSAAVAEEARNFMSGVNRAPSADEDFDEEFDDDLDDEITDLSDS